MKTICSILGSVLAIAAASAQLPRLELPAGAGVNIHFVRGHEKDLDMIAAAGFKFIRMDFGWEGIERQKGAYDWSAYDELTANLEKRGLRAIYILDYSNPLYEQVAATRDPITGKESRGLASPQQADSVAAFARWAAAAAVHFREHPVVWEVWNEPNIFFWKPKPDARQYTALALATAKAVRQVNPQATIIGPASSEFPWAFLESFLASGILEYLDGVSVHPYRDYRQAPETAAADYLKLRALIERHAPTPAKRSLPIISGEWGYASHRQGVSPETQAAFLVRQQMANLIAGIPLSIWYDWKNDGNDPGEREHNFGTVLPDLAPKPAYRAAQTLTREMSGASLRRLSAATNQNDYVLQNAGPSGPRTLAAWTMGEPHRLVLSFAGTGPSAVTAISMTGQTNVLQMQTGRLEFELGPYPVYLRLPDGWSVK